VPDVKPPEKPAETVPAATADPKPAVPAEAKPPRPVVKCPAAVVRKPTEEN
jgi:hypothetical protein